MVKHCPEDCPSSLRLTPPEVVQALGGHVVTSRVFGWKQINLLLDAQIKKLEGRDSKIIDRYPGGTSQCP